MIRLIGPNRKNYLPMLRRSVYGALDKNGAGTQPVAMRQVPLVVYAPLPYNNGSGWQRTTAPAAVPNVNDIDWFNGVITFPYLFGTVAAQGLAMRGGSNFFPFAAPSGGSGGSFYVKFSMESNIAGDYTDAYAAAFTLDSGGAVTDYDLPTAMAGAGGEDVVIREFPELLELRNATVASDGSLSASSLNATVLYPQAKLLAQGVLGAKYSARIRKFVGFQQIDCDGLVSSVTWDLQSAITKVQYQMHTAPIGDCAAKEEFKWLTDSFKSAGQQTRTAPRRPATVPASMWPAPALPGVR